MKRDALLAGDIAPWRVLDSNPRTPKTKDSCEIRDMCHQARRMVRVELGLCGNSKHMVKHVISQRMDGKCSPSPNVC